MSTPQRDYQRISAVHVSRFDQALQEVVPGWELKYRWNRTGTIIPLFVPDAYYTPEQVDALVRQAGAVDEQMAGLGGSSRGAA